MNGANNRTGSGAAHASGGIEPFRIEVPQADLDDLADRLARTRWANELPLDASGPQTDPVPPGWEYRVLLDYVRNLGEYWRAGKRS
jgi:epoxide hydrolase